MSKERELLRQYARLFCHRRDKYARQRKDGSYFLVRERVTEALLQQHFAGELTCGWYALANNHTIRWLALDVDEEDGLLTLQRVWEQLQGLNIQAYLEDSRRGGHVWIFVEPVRAFVMRALVSKVLDELEIGDVEIYPRQDELPPGGVGSLVRGPLGVHRLTNQRYLFLDPVQLKPVGQSLPEQLEYLMACEVNSIHRVAEALAVLVTEVRRPVEKSNERTRTEVTLDHNQVEALKAAIGDLYAFVSQYVDLDARGRGSCPFHPPDRHPSFAVNREEDYWVCFHETNPQTGRYLGGDAIEFYQRLKGLSFKQAVRELAEQYQVTGITI